MEESHKEAAPQTQEPAVQEKNQTEIENPEAFMAKQKEILAELKAEREKRKELENFKKDLEQKELEKNGQYEDVIKQLKEERDNLAAEKDKKIKDFAYRRFQDQIISTAKEQGCVKPDLLLKLMTEDQMKSVSIDDNFDIDKKELGSLMENLKKEYADIGLFKSGKINHNPANVTKTETQKEEPKGRDAIISSIADGLLNR